MEGWLAIENMATVSCFLRGGGNMGDGKMIRGKDCLFNKRQVRVVHLRYRRSNIIDRK